MLRIQGAKLIEAVIAALIKFLVWPICRMYARYLGDNPADSIYRFLCSLQFWNVYRFWPDLKRPSLFSEKLWSRMLHVRNPILTVVCDKIKVRQYVVDKVGSECLIPLLWSGKDPSDIPFERLPDRFVIKANHGCGYNIIVTSKATLNQLETKRKLSRWLHENFGLDKYLGAAWGYKNISPAILIESFITESGQVPTDYKFYCFSGITEVMTMHFNRFKKHETKAFDRKGEPLVFGKEFHQYNQDCQKPQNFDEMLYLAETLAESFDFIRVDLYRINNKIFFGELTPYPAGVSGFHGLNMKILDKPLGEKWLWALIR
jgi:hypothetical protein